MAVNSLPNQIPVIQSSDSNLVQTQVNVNRINRGLGNKIQDLDNSIIQMTIVGEIKFANLTINQFQQVAGNDWVLANGQSCVGSAYANLTKNTTVPTISVSGTTAFVRIN